LDKQHALRKGRPNKNGKVIEKTELHFYDISNDLKKHYAKQSKFEKDYHI